MCVFPDSSRVGDVIPEGAGQSQSGRESGKAPVKDLEYYNALGLPPDAPQEAIKRAYYVMAKVA